MDKEAIARVKDWLASTDVQWAEAGMALEYIAELEAGLGEIAEGQIDEGGNRRNHPHATAMARKLLRLE